MTEREIFQCLKHKYGGDDFALLPQVRSTTGTGAARTADALAIGLWPSRGIHIHGFEFKDSRRDWLSELKKPAKADEIAALCHYWWVVFSAEACYKIDEVPAPWGVLVCHGGKVSEIRKATLNPEPKVPSWLFLAAVLRRAAAQQAGEDEIAAAVRKAVSDAQDAAYKESQAVREKYKQEARKEYCELHNKVRQFEDASGVTITAQWERAERIGHAVKMVLNGGLDSKVAQITAMRENADRISRELAIVLREISTPPEQPCSRG